MGTTPKRCRTLALAALCVAAPATVVTGCGSSKASPSSTSSAASASSTGGKATRGKHVNIALVETFTATPFFQQLKTGAEDAGAVDNASVSVQGPSQSTGTAEATLAQNLVQKENWDGFGVNPCVLPAWTQADAQIARAVPNDNVVAFDCAPVASATASSPVKTYVGSDEKTTGEAAVQTSVKAAHIPSTTTGTVLIATCDPNVPTLTDRDQGAAVEVKKLLPKATIVNFTSGLSESANTAAWTSAAEKYPHVVLGYGACDQDLQSMLELRTHGVAGDFATAGADLSVPELEGIKTGKFTAAVATGPWIQGYVAAQLLIDGARGKPAPKGWVDSGLYPITRANVSGWLKAIGGSNADMVKFMTPLADKVLSNLPAATHPMADLFK